MRWGFWAGIVQEELGMRVWGLALQKQEAQVLLGDDGREEGMGLKSEFEHSSESHKLLPLLALQHVVSVKQSLAIPALCMQNAQAALSRAVLGVC